MTEPTPLPAAPPREYRLLALLMRGRGRRREAVPFAAACEGYPAALAGAGAALLARLGALAAEGWRLARRAHRGRPPHARAQERVAGRWLTYARPPRDALAAPPESLREAPAAPPLWRLVARCKAPDGSARLAFSRPWRAHPADPAAPAGTQPPRGLVCLRRARTGLRKKLDRLARKGVKAPARAALQCQRPGEGWAPAGEARLTPRRRRRLPDAGGHAVTDAAPPREYRVAVRLRLGRASWCPASATFLPLSGGAADAARGPAAALLAWVRREGWPAPALADLESRPARGGPWRREGPVPFAAAEEAAHA